jgi:hypothetical protein
MIFDVLAFNTLAFCNAFVTLFCGIETVLQQQKFGYNLLQIVPLSYQTNMKIDEHKSKTKPAF